MLPIWKLLGFLLYVVLYFSLLESYDRWPIASLKSCFFKILPIIHLMFIIISSSEEENQTKSSSYRIQILLGLSLSLAGDVALVYIDDYFILGVFLFSLAQAVYVYAFGMSPFGSGPTAASFAVVGVVLYLYVVQSIGDDVALKIILLVYSLLIMTMAWRATVQFARKPSLENFCAVVGAVLFVVSDTILAIDRWKGSFHMAPFWNMVTYYTAQLGIALSASNTLPGKFYEHIVTKKDK